LQVPHAFIMGEFGHAASVRRLAVAGSVHQDAPRAQPWQEHCSYAQVGASGRAFTHEFDIWASNEQGSCAGRPELRRRSVHTESGVSTAAQPERRRRGSLRATWSAGIANSADVEAPGARRHPQTLKE
jgi:hypothetical protein